MPTLADLLTDSTAAAELEDLLTRATDLGANARGWQAERVQRVLFECDAQALADWKRIRVQVVKGGFITEATGLWLDLAATWYQELRNPPIATQGFVTLVDAANTGPWPYGDGELLVAFNATSSKPLYFRGISAGVLPKNGSLQMEVRAVEAGAAYNQPSSAVVQIVAPQKPGVTISNPPVAGLGSWLTVVGSDAEKDDLLRTRCMAKWGALGAGGNIDAIIYRILKAGNGGVTRYKIQSNVLGYGTVRAYLANDLLPISDALALTITNFLQEKKANGTGNQVAYPATTLSIPILGTLFATGKAADQLSAVNQRFLALQATFNIGDEVFDAQIDAAAISKSTGAFDWVRTQPADNVIAQASDVVIFQPNVTISSS